MEIDETGSFIFLEIRDTASKQVSFTSIDLNNGRVHFKDLSMPERWLTGIEAAYDGVLLIHNYQSENGPVHKGLTAIDGITGRALWGNYTLAFDQLSVNGPVVYNAQVQPKRLMLTDIKTGATLRAYEPVIDTLLNNHIKTAQLLPASFLGTIELPAKPYGNTVHYMEHNSYRIVSLHTFLAGQLEQHLYIFDNEGNIVHCDLLQAGIQKLQPEAFVVHKNKLIYLKNRSELIVLNLQNTVL
ncbi:hypothetical protein GCM10022210_04270 [Mucilaginibacter dorajii]|uniref:DUF4905 domain-containing protein n=1 Tax=Mucilaginibacter dorajii TaxID=692994 RepID=A0ABP7P528_9SPHI